MAYRTDRAVQQQQEEVASAAGMFRDPGGLQGTSRYSWRRKPTGHARRFARSSTDSVAKFKEWGEFKRQGDRMETHLLTIYICEHCGDYFACSDSCHRHYENRLAECLRVTLKKAGAKRRATQMSIGRLEG